MAVGQEGHRLVMQTNLNTQSGRLIGPAAAIPITEQWLVTTFLAQVLDSGFRPLPRPGDQAQLMSLI